MKSTAQQLEDLLAPNVAQFDPEAADALDDGPALLASDDEDAVATKPLKVKPEKRLRRPNLEMDDMSYEARKVHRKHFDGMESDDSPEDSKSESSGTDGAGSAEEDSEGARSEGIDSEEMDSDEWGGAEMSAHANEAVEGDWQDLEQEFATLQSRGAKPLGAAATGSRVKKAAAVETQCRLWNSTLGIRITLQRSLAAADRFPRGPAHKCVMQDVPQAPEAVDTARKAAIDVLLSCMDSMHHLLMQVAPSASKGSVKVAPSSVSTAEQLVQGDREACTALWPQMEDLEDRFSSFRDDELDRWHRKTMLATGRTALKSAEGLQALNKPISQQVSDMLQAPDRALRKVQRQRQPHESVLCEPRPHEDSTHAKDVPGGDDSVDTQVDVHAGDGMDEATDAGEEQWQLRRDMLAGAAFDVARDVESFDDSAFYQVLLQEFLESAQTEGLIADKMKMPKHRKLVDRRASKGRKIRFNILDKLVNFMEPVQVYEGDADGRVAALYGNLFGHGGR